MHAANLFRAKAPHDHLQGYQGNQMTPKANSVILFQVFILFFQIQELRNGSLYHPYGHPL